MVSSGGGGGGGSLGQLFRNVFPSTSSFFIFIAYMAGFVAYGLLITASQDKSHADSYPYSTTTVILLSEWAKLFVAIVLYVSEFSLATLVETHRNTKNLRVFVLYSVPAFLYALVNNLAFVNLANYDPTTYFLLLQFRVVVTGVVYQWLFNKRLSRTQWVSLLVLTAGCVVKQYGYAVRAADDDNITAAVEHHAGGGAGHDPLGSDATLRELAERMFNGYLLLILVQVFCSCFAGVYNELLLKQVDLPTQLQNQYMYAWSIIVNFGILWAAGDLGKAMSPENVAAVMSIRVFPIILNNAAIGIITSLFLKRLNSILKTFASAMELQFTAIFAWLLFGIPVDAYTIGAIAVVTVAILLYSRNPVTSARSAGSGEPRIAPRRLSEGLPTVDDKETDSNA